MSPPHHPLLQFGAPPDVVAWAAFALGVLIAAVLLWGPGRERARRLLLAQPRLVLAALAVGATGLSLVYVHFYLRGGPRIIDATAYFLQARAFLDGGPTFPVPTPSAAFRGRFLVPTPDAAALGVLFPPGYPAVLAGGFALGRPLWVGPLLGAALVLATYGLALRLSGRPAVALLAATLSVVSAALRYHTADTMSHGLAALLFTTALWASVTPGRLPETAEGAPLDRSGPDPPAPGPLRPLRPLRHTVSWRAVVGGICVGWLIATRPVTGVVCAAVCAWLLAAPWSLGGPWAARPSTWAARWVGALARLLPFAVGALPGLALLLWQQLELTGQLFGSVQLRYYALADGPPGCFGLGLGSGCQHEHGDVVARFGDGGFGIHWALRHTLYRLHHHALDFANWEPAWLLVPWACWRHRKERSVLALTCAAVGVVAAYGAFYFPGNYPGGGARFFAELLPLEHALVAWASYGAWSGRWLLPTALLGFACHGSYSHRALSEREGGRPMFEPEVVSQALQAPTLPGERRGALLFVDTDHAFNLGYDPALGRRLASGEAPFTATAARRGGLPGRRLAPGELLVARTTSPDRDRLLWERLGRPPAYAHRLLQREHEPQIELLPWSVSFVEAPGALPASDGAVDRAPGRLRFEAEHDWPPLTVREGWSQPSFPVAPCASGARALTFHALGLQSALGAELDPRRPGLHRVSLGLILPPPDAAPSAAGAAGAAPRLRIGEHVLPLTLPSAAAGAEGHICARVELPPVPVGHTVRWLLETGGASLTLDYVEIQPVGSPPQAVQSR